MDLRGSRFEDRRVIKDLRLYKIPRDPVGHDIHNGYRVV